MLKTLLILAMVATVTVLVFGIFALFKGGEFNRRYGNQAMRWRVLLQTLTLIIFALLLWRNK